MSRLLLGMSIALVAGGTAGVGTGCGGDTFSGAQPEADAGGGDAGAAGSAGKDGGGDAGAAQDGDAGKDAAKDGDAGDVVTEEAGPQCKSTEKLCDNQCVLKTEPSYGCGGTSCDACTLAHASVICLSTGDCGIEKCENGWADCDKDKANGCEAELASNTSHCGQCGHPCSYPNATPMCVGGECKMGACNTDFADCDTTESTGCESNLKSDSQNCSVCGKSCTSGTSTQHCEGGLCVLDNCQSGLADCDGNSVNGCEINVQTDPQHCGSCPYACVTPEATPKCEDGKCGILSCNANYLDCDLNWQTGCEIDSLTDVLHCGTCANACSLANATPECIGGACAVKECVGTWRDCDTQASTGCEVDTAVSLSHCGGCGTPCSASHATTVCATSVCGISKCDDGYADCDTGIGNGCEINILNDVTHCGSCANTCQTPNATPACVSGSCSVGLCNADFLNCDSDWVTGCEINSTNDANHCGACNNKCTLANATSACNAKVCEVTGCVGAFLNCNGLSPDGCEIDSANNASHCGLCNHACVTPNATPACVTGQCAIGQCTTGYKDCDNDWATGCEINSLTSLAHCGGCNQPCAAVAHGSPGCDNGSCVIAICDSGYTDCNGTYADGCEINTQTDPGHCGACTTACDLPNVNVNGCAAGSCTISTCDAGWMNCDTSTTNGCEQNTATDVNHCGGCTTVCALAHATPQCTAGVCKVLSCNAGWANCNGIDSDGCEVDLTSTAAHCGACGHDCLGGNCSTSTCQPSILAPAQVGVNAIAIDSGYVYWAIFSGTGSIRRAPLAGGGWTSLCNANNPDGIALDPTNGRVYFADQGTDTIRYIAKTASGGTSTQIWYGLNNDPAGVAVSGNYVYWTTWNGGTVRRVALAGGTSDLLASSQANPHRIAVNNTHAFWTVFSSADVRRVPIAGGTIEPVGLGPGNPVGVALDGTSVYWTAQGSNSVWKAALNGASPVELASGQGTPTGIAVDSQYVYWTNYGTGTISRVPLGGGTPVVLVTGQSNPANIVVDNQAIYWTNPGDSTVRKLAK